MGDVGLSDEVLSDTDLSTEQQAALEAWLPGAELVEDLSWGLVDTVVLHVRHEGRDLTVKAYGPRNHHLERELRGHTEFTGPLLGSGAGGGRPGGGRAGGRDRVPRLVDADLEARVLVATWLPGRLVEGDPAEWEPEAYRQAGELTARWHDQPGRVSTTWLRETRDRALRWLSMPHRIPAEQVAAVQRWAWPDEPVTLVPTHGDLGPRNWVVDDGVVSFIDLGRADLRPACTDLARMTARQWRGRADLEAAFLEGYGTDPRPAWWRSLLLAEAVAAAAWAHQVGDAGFEAEGLRSVGELLAAGG